ncbi:MAG: response regulator [Candidatus Methylacidiphilales bacterium]|nr:response regulator [Candidatus Methylacidiphilales bacterium]
MSLQVLLYEPDPGLGGLLESLIFHVAPEALLHQASSLFEAQRIAGAAKPDVLVLDLEAGQEAHDLLMDFRTYHPLARMLLLVPQNLPEGFENALRSGAVHFLPKPFTSEQAAVMLSWLLNPGSLAADSFYQAHLHHVSLLEVLQMKIQGGFTTQLEIVSSVGPRGRIILEQGKIVHAVAGSLQGETAFEEILCWRGGAITESPAPVPVFHSITIDSPSLLLDAARLLDQKMQSQAQASAEAVAGGNVAAAAFAERVVSLGGVDEEEQTRFLALPKILVVDDNPMILQCAEEMLVHTWPSHAIIGVETGAEGMECAQLYRPQVILLDYALPDFNGDAFAAKLRTDPELGGIPIVLMSGFPDQIRTASLNHPNIIGTLAKPFMMKELVQQVKKAMEFPPPPVHPEVRQSLRAAGGLTTRIMQRHLRQRPIGAATPHRSTVRISHLPERG